MNKNIKEVKDKGKKGYLFAEGVGIASDFSDGYIEAIRPVEKNYHFPGSENENGYMPEIYNLPALYSFIMGLLSFVVFLAYRGIGCLGLPKHECCGKKVPEVCRRNPNLDIEDTKCFSITCIPGKSFFVLLCAVMMFPLIQFLIKPSANFFNENKAFFWIPLVAITLLQILMIQKASFCKRKSTESLNTAMEEGWSTKDSKGKENDTTQNLECEGSRIGKMKVKKWEEKFFDDRTVLPKCNIPEYQACLQGALSLQDDLFKEFCEIFDQLVKDCEKKKNPSTRKFISKNEHGSLYGYLLCKEEKKGCITFYYAIHEVRNPEFELSSQDGEPKTEEIEAFTKNYQEKEVMKHVMESESVNKYGIANDEREPSLLLKSSFTSSLTDTGGQSVESSIESGYDSGYESSQDKDGDDKDGEESGEESGEDPKDFLKAPKPLYPIVLFTGQIIDNDMGEDTIVESIQNLECEGSGEDPKAPKPQNPIVLKCNEKFLTFSIRTSSKEERMNLRFNNRLNGPEKNPENYHKTSRYQVNVNKYSKEYAVFSGFDEEGRNPEISLYVEPKTTRERVNKILEEHCDVFYPQLKLITQSFDSSFIVDSGKFPVDVDTFEIFYQKNFVKQY